MSDPSLTAFGDLADHPQFERVFLISLQERDDKLDAFTFAASLTGFSYDLIEGIKGTTIVDKALPSLDNVPKVVE